MVFDLGALESAFFEHRTGDAVFGKEPIKFGHRALPSFERHERKGQTTHMTKKQPWAAANIVAVRLAGADDRRSDEVGPVEQSDQFGRARPVHRVDRIAMMWIAERHT